MNVEKMLTLERPRCFQFKTSFSPCTVMQVTAADVDRIEAQLSTMMAQTPDFFHSTPIVIDIEKIPPTTFLDFARLKQLLIHYHMVPMGIRGGSLSQQIAAQTQGLLKVNVGKSTVATAVKKAPEYVDKTKVVTQPIRSGMQVYANEGDLIVAAQVSSGAELMADGHIHVYGALRGRALAGVQGNKQARIFCKQLDADLVAIAGLYLTREDIGTLSNEGSMVQIYLENEQIKIAAI